LRFSAKIRLSTISDRTAGESLFFVPVSTLYYREMPDCWLVAGVFHAQRDPDWIQSQLLIRESHESTP
jgi:hypothetical protein